MFPYYSARCGCFLNAGFALVSIKTVLLTTVFFSPNPVKHCFIKNVCTVVCNKESAILKHR